MPRIGLVEQSDLTRNSFPFKLSLDGLASLFHLIFLPLKKFIAANKCEQIPFLYVRVEEFERLTQSEDEVG
jgi:hypothetical protein